MNHDVELKCDGCGRETLATDGCWVHACWACNGTRRVIRRHDHVLTWDEAKALGFSLSPRDETTAVVDFAKSHRALHRRKRN